jgi:hypothetical protein
MVDEMGFEPTASSTAMRQRVPSQFDSGEGSGPNVCRFGLSGWLLRDDAGIAALPSVQIVGLSGYEINVSWWVEPLRW